ncbi:MAG: peptidylprolyl isomerase [Gammaproteobacteria bacterium]
MVISIVSTHAMSSTRAIETRTGSESLSEPASPDTNTTPTDIGDESGNRTEIERIIAVVNDDVITSSELANQIRLITKQLREQNIPMPPADVIKKQVLQRLVETKIQLQRATRIGIQINDDMLNKTITQIANKNKLTLNEFKDILQKDGYDFNAFREDIRTEITIRQLRQRQVESLISVTEREVDNHLVNQRAQGRTDIEFHLAHILIALPEAATPDQIAAAKNKAQQTLEKIKEGKDFAQMAVEVSDGSQALSGGDLGWRKASMLPAFFISQISELKKGEMTNLMRDSSGFHILKLLDQRNSERHFTKQTLARHILIKTNELVSDKNARGKLKKIRAQIVDGKPFTDAAREFSEDTASGINGGDLGWINPGQMVPEFEKMVDMLASQEISQPFKTRFGWHIVQVLDRRKHDDTEQYTRSKAREDIYQRKVEEEYGKWLRRLRDEAYVEERI